MPTIAGSPYKPRPPIVARESVSPGPPAPPPKAIDLNSSTRSTDKETGAKVTRRAFLCDVIVDCDGDETTNLLSHMGRPLASVSALPPVAPPALRLDSTDDEAMSADRTERTKEKQGDTSKKLEMLTEELVRTEKSYLSRIKALKINYADNLRAYAKQAYSTIIPLYEAKTIFANIDNIVPASAVFLADLEAMPAGAVGDVCLKHLKDLRTFDPYRTYLGKQDESQKMFQDVLRKYPGFASFIESTKYQTTGIGNIGLRELLMEPVQRIPRYTLLWHAMLQCLPPLSNQRAKLQEAIDIASRIAKCEPDAQTVRATIMYCLERSIDGFPASLFSNNRDYLDAIDVDDLPADFPLTMTGSRPVSLTSTSTSTPSLSSLGSSNSHVPTSPQSNVGASNLHCSLFLFDDKIMIVKRQSSAISGKKVTGLDDVQRLVKSGGGVSVIDKSVSRKDKLSYRGVVDILDVIATDNGNGDFHLFFERPPTDQTERWSGRPFRAYTTVNPPFNSLDPGAARRDKLRFVQNLWSAQAFARSKLLPKEVYAPPKVMIGSEEVGLEWSGEMFGRAGSYLNIWDRTSWNAAIRRAKVAIIVDEVGSEPDLPLSDETLMTMRLQPMSGGLCRFSHATASDEGERIVINVEDINEKIINTIHRYGIFMFKTSTQSAPTTPSSNSHRLRPSMLNLDAISRNLFGTGSISGRSYASGSSGDMFGTSSSKRSKPGVSRTSTINTSMSDDSSAKTPSSLNPYETGMGQSELDLNERLNLARKNSKSMAALKATAKDQRGRLGAKSVAELRSRVEAEAHPGAQGMPTGTGAGSPLPPSAPLRIRNKTPSPTRALSPTEETPKPLQALQNDVFTSPRALDIEAQAPSSPRPQGPRSPVPRSTIGSAHTRLRVVSGGGRRVSAGRETVPLKDVEPHDTPTATKRQHSADQLSPRKRSPSRSPLDLNVMPEPLKVPSLSRKPGPRRISGQRTPIRSSGPLTTPRTVSAHSVASNDSKATDDVVMTEHADIVSAVGAIRERLLDSRKTAKRVRSDIQGLRKQIAGHPKKRTPHLDRTLDRNPSLPRSPQRRNINRIADTDSYDTLRQKSEVDVMDESARGVSVMVDRLDSNLKHALADGEQAIVLGERLVVENRKTREDLKSTQSRLSRSKETIDMLRQQLADTQMEVDVIYEAFNKELDGMFDDCQLPHNDAFEAMRKDLQQAKARRNELGVENMRLKRELEESNLKREQWAKVLRERGII